MPTTILSEPKFVRTVSLKNLQRELIKLAEERPDFVYSDHYKTCQYVDEESNPCCIVGHALVRLNIDPARLEREAEWEEIVYDFIPDSETDEYELIEWVQDVQLYQDTDGVSWGDAIKRANTQQGVIQD